MKKNENKIDSKIMNINNKLVKYIGSDHNKNQILQFLYEKIENDDFKIEYFEENNNLPVFKSFKSEQNSSISKFFNNNNNN